ncbi:MAG: hypothetical protein ACYTFI_08200, partial [Planctomycetota bacterium]
MSGSKRLAAAVGIWALAAASAAFAATSTEAPEGGYCAKLDIPITGADLLALQSDDGNSGSCYAEKANLISNHEWLSVYFDSTIPTDVTITSAVLYVDCMGTAADKNGEINIYVSPNREVTQWYSGADNDSTLDTDWIVYSGVSTVVSCDLYALSFITTPTHVNSCEVLVVNRTNSDDILFFDYFSLEVEYDDPPGPFNLLTPASGAVDQSLTPTLDWEDSVGVVTYTLTVDNDSDFSSPVVEDSTLTASQYTVGAGDLSAGVMYYWKVTAFNAMGQKDADNNYFSFTTLNPAVTFTWDGGGADNNWSTGANWVGDVAPDPAVPDDIVFAGATRLTPNVDVAWSVNSITFAATADTFTIGGAQLTIDAGGITNNDTDSTQTIDCTIDVAAAQTWTAVDENSPLILNGDLTGSGDVTFSNSQEYLTIQLGGSNS